MTDEEFWKQKPPGKADWIWDGALGLHLPCCSNSHDGWKCGNGPLTGKEELETGLCSECKGSDVRPKPYDW